MSSIQDLDLASILTPRGLLKKPVSEAAAAETAVEPSDGRAEDNVSDDGTNLPVSPLSSAVQGILIQNQAVSPSSGVPRAALIVAADILALDTVKAADTNHNGSLSKAEIAAISPGAALSSDSLDTNADGQVSADELAGAMLQGTMVFSA